MLWSSWARIGPSWILGSSAAHACWISYLIHSFCILLCDMFNKLHFHTTHKTCFSLPFGHLRLRGKCLPAPLRFFYTKPTYRTNGIPLMNFGWKWDKKVFHRRSPHSKNCIVLDALAWRRVLAKFFNLVKWLVFSTTLAGCESDHSCSSLWNALEKSAELGGALHFLLMMESHRLSSLYSFW